MRSFLHSSCCGQKKDARKGYFLVVRASAMTRKVGGGVLGRPLHLELVGLDVWTKKGSSFEELDVYKKSVSTN